MQMTSSSTRLELSSVDQFCQENPAFKPGGIRWLIFNEKQNGLEQSGAIVRIGRRVYIDQPKFFQWVESQQRRG